jgi:hypothetical protein
MVCTVSGPDGPIHWRACSLVIVVALLLAGCCSAPRFTHVDVDGPAPFVFFDQKTKQMCWADSESHKGEAVAVTITLHGLPTKVNMPVCKDLE